ncbi:hypothetical protein F2P81_013327 [Scophthalmus maximus]|uniref:Uncharacterized protein n=1 Tax=Scophthalmus maximus TaxID=52904 RepID=A0A6A4SSC0_SCOMX|nr:hypothetical protein F2P81_013327 [Scophthalmus maximus]
MTLIPLQTREELQRRYQQMVNTSRSEECSDSAQFTRNFKKPRGGTLMISSDMKSTSQDFYLQQSRTFCESTD